MHVSYYSSVSQVFNEQQDDITTIFTSDECNFKTSIWARITEGAKDVMHWCLLCVLKQCMPVVACNVDAG